MAALPAPPAPARDAIFAAYEADREDGRRPHLGASQIGKACERALWYDFRWATPARFPGRILRLFETGQLEEARLVRNLRRIGVTVLEVDPETGRQWRVEAHGGHFGGSLNAVALGLIEARKTWHVLEFKTHSAKSFRELVRQERGRGEAAALGADASLHAPDRPDPRNVPRGLQGHRRSARRAGARRWRRGRAAAREGGPGHPRRPAAGPRLRGPRLVRVPVLRPPRALPWRGRRRRQLSLLPALHADGGWHCARWDQALDVDTQRQGCARHLFIPDLGPGEVVDAGDDHVVYRMRDANTWVNDARAEAVAC